MAAGGALFHLVLDDHTQAAKLLDLLRRERKGRVTCLPLNKLRADTVRYPEGFGDDAIPLLKYLDTDKHFETAVKHVSSDNSLHCSTPFLNCSCEMKWTTV